MSNRFSVFERDATAGYLIDPTGRFICLGVKQFKAAAGFRMPYGGMVNPGESHENCMVRELREESGVQCTTSDLEKVGILSIYKYKGNDHFEKLMVAVYLIHSWIGRPRETSEIKDPRWFSTKALPLSTMLPADRVWLPRVLAGKNVMVEAFYDPRYRLHPKRPPKIEEYLRPRGIY